MIYSSASDPPNSHSMLEVSLVEYYFLDFSALDYLFIRKIQDT